MYTALRANPQICIENSVLNFTFVFNTFADMAEVLSMNCADTILKNRMYPLKYGNIASSVLLLFRVFIRTDNAVVI